MFTITLATNRLVGSRFRKITSQSAFTRSELSKKFKTSRLGLVQYELGLRSLPGELIPVLLDFKESGSDDEFFFCSLNLNIVNDYIEQNMFLRVINKIEKSFR